MPAVIGWILLLGPLIKPFFTRFLPFLGRKIAGWVKFGKGGPGTILVGGSVSEAITRYGAVGAILGVLTKVWGFLMRFPAWIYAIFGAGGFLHFIPRFCLFIVKHFKSPYMIVISMITSSFFPNILEKIMLLVGVTALKLFLFVFRICKQLFLSTERAMEQGGVDEFRQAVLNSVSGLPQPMIDVMGYLHLLEDIGLIITTATICIMIRAFRRVYSSFTPVLTAGYIDNWKGRRV